MAKARIQLVKGRSLSAHGRTLLKGYPQTITDAADIRYYESVGSVKVVRLQDDVSEKIETTEVKKEEEKEQLETEKSEDDAAFERPKKSKKAAEYSEDELNQKKKRVLIEIAAALGVYVEGSDKKKEIVASIIEAQNLEG